MSQRTFGNSRNFPTLWLFESQGGAVACLRLAVVSLVSRFGWDYATKRTWLRLKWADVDLRSQRCNHGTLLPVWRVRCVWAESPSPSRLVWTCLMFHDWNQGGNLMMLFKVKTDFFKRFITFLCMWHTECRQRLTDFTNFHIINVYFTLSVTSPQKQHDFKSVSETDISKKLKLTHFIRSNIFQLKLGQKGDFHSRFFWVITSYRKLEITVSSVFLLHVEAGRQPSKSKPNLSLSVIFITPPFSHSFILPRSILEPIITCCSIPDCRRRRRRRKGGVFRD